MKRVSFTTKLMGALVLVLAGLLIWNGIQNGRIRRDSKEVPIDYAQYTSDIAYNKLCRMEVKGLIHVGAEITYYRDSTSAETAKYYLAILKDGGNGLVKLDTIGGMQRTCSPWIINDEEELEELDSAETLTLLGRTAQMPNLTENSIDSLLLDMPDNSEFTNDMLEKITLLETDSEYKETEMVVPSYASLGDGVTLVVVLLIIFGVKFVKRLNVDMKMTEKERSTVITPSNGSVNKEEQDDLAAQLSSKAAPKGTPDPAALAKMAAASREPELDDMTYIQEIKHTPNGPWHQYDVLLAVRGYGWDMMVAWADYMASADLEGISEVTVGMFEKNITELYVQNDHKLAGLPEVAQEEGMLTIAGFSKTLRVPTKIVWYNQTRVLRIHTLEKDELLVKKYVETMARGTFGTETAMRLGKPIPKA